MIEGGQLDAGQLDAGQLDAGQLDAGQLDAGQLLPRHRYVAEEVAARAQACRDGSTTRES